jgi:hypothetical protein
MCFSEGMRDEVESVDGIIRAGFYPPLHACSPPAFGIVATFDIGRRGNVSKPLNVQLVSATPGTFNIYFWSEIVKHSLLLISGT